MSDAKANIAEEIFEFPKHAGFFCEGAKKAYAMGLVKQLHVSEVVPVRVGPGHLDQTTVYEYEVKIDVVQAVMLRNAWLRPIGSLDGALPVTFQVLVDGEVVLKQPLHEHIYYGPPHPVRRCSCNSWANGVECKCQIQPLSANAELPFHAIALTKDLQAEPGRPYGIFMPNKSLVQIRIVKPGRGPVDFQARCGITAALYSTRSSDFSA